jgi:hypothetical protein
MCTDFIPVAAPYRFRQLKSDWHFTPKGRPSSRTHNAFQSLSSMTIAWNWWLANASRISDLPSRKLITDVQTSSLYLCNCSSSHHFELRTSCSHRSIGLQQQARRSSTNKNFLDRKHELRVSFWRLLATTFRRVVIPPKKKNKHAICSATFRILDNKIPLVTLFHRSRDDWTST